MQNFHSSTNFQIELHPDQASSSGDTQHKISEKQANFHVLFQHLTEEEQTCYTQDLKKLIHHFEYQFNLENTERIIQPNSLQLNPNVCNKLSYLNILSQVTLQKMKAKFSQIRSQTDLKLQVQREKNEKLKKMIENQEKKTQPPKPRKKRRTKNSNKAEKLD